MFVGDRAGTDIDFAGRIVCGVKVNAVEDIVVGEGTGKART